MPDSPSKKPERKSPYTADRGIPGAFEGETITRRNLMTGAALTYGGIATAAFALPALGFALGPMFEESQPTRWQDVGPESDFNDETYIPAVMNTVPEIGDPGKTTVYIRKVNPELDSDSEALNKGPGGRPQPYVAISTRCMHLGCPVRYVAATARFGCPCHGGVYDFEGKVEGGPPVRPLDRFDTRVRGGRVEVGARFSVNSQLDRHKPRDPSNWLDGLWQYIYPSRPTIG